MLYFTRNKTEYLIKSGGGTGPVKPGNLMAFLPYVRKGAKSCGIYPKDEEFHENFAALGSSGAVFNIRS